MQLSLRPHSNTPCTVVQSLQAEIALQANGSWLFHYALQADKNALRIPVLQASTAIDGLWEHTCLEAFIGVTGETAYHEFNFSPSTQWAAYAFHDYRERVAWTASTAPAITVAQTATGLVLEARIAAADLPKNPAQLPWQIGLTAVIETVTGEKSYWALQHPAAKPDFHQRGGFAMTLMA